MAGGLAEHRDREQDLSALNADPSLVSLLVEQTASLFGRRRPNPSAHRPDAGHVHEFVLDLRRFRGHFFSPLGVLHLDNTTVSEWRGIDKVNFWGKE